MEEKYVLLEEITYAQDNGYQYDDAYVITSADKARFDFLRIAINHPHEKITVDVHRIRIVPYDEDIYNNGDAGLIDMSDWMYLYDDYPGERVAFFTNNEGDQFCYDHGMI